MDLYVFCLALGFCGLLLMALAGFGHHSHGHGAAHHGAGHGTPHGGLKLAKHALPAHGSGAGRSLRENAGIMLLGLFSPRAFLSILLGFGATGLVLGQIAVLPSMLLLALAVIGGFAFERLLIQPFWRFLFGFASDPARTLDTAVQEETVAATDFDADGRGLVAVELDGQVRQVLGRLCPEERAQGSGRVRTGDRLVIQAVDDRRNTCTVSRLRAC